MPYNFLVVDDSFVARDVITKVVYLSGVPVKEVFQAANGEEALGMLRSHQIDLVFSDINMPVMSGIELLDRMAADSVLKLVPVVVISTEGSATRIDQFMQKGARGYLRKPFTPEAIRKLLNSVLEGGADGNG